MSPHGRVPAATAPAPAGAVARTRQRVLAALRAQQHPTTIAALAGRVGIHPNTARFHLERLIADGYAERVAGTPSGPGRPAVRVRAVPGMAGDGTRHFRLLAEVLSSALADAPGGAALAEQAGRELGWRLAAEAPDAAPLTTLVRMLEDLDFAPVATDATGLELRSCPFLELVGNAGGIACAVHLGLMRGALAATGGGLDIAELTPFATPERCVTHLRTAA